MKPLTFAFQADAEYLKRRIDALAPQIKGPSLDRERTRELLSDAGLNVHALSLPPDVSFPLGLLAADAAFAVQAFRHSVVWASSSVAVSARADGGLHVDALVGRGNTPYFDVEYAHRFDAGVLCPPNQVESRTPLIRIAGEYRLLAEEGGKGDLRLVDGSIAGNRKAIKNAVGKEAEEASDAQKKLFKSGKIAAMCEDSHASDIAQKIGYETSNITVFSAALNPLEYVVVEEEGVFVVYLILPQKRLSYTVERVSAPLAVRWEFSYGDYEKDLSALARLWTLEDDIIHPQIYPLRVADYLTRRIKVGSIIKETAREHNLDLQYRDVRTT
ncbi:Uncharacterised protein [uncultured archaeon]|nr:Uncharacterised protein [uncultured archaeon]